MRHASHAPHQALARLAFPIPFRRTRARARPRARHGRARHLADRTWLSSRHGVCVGWFVRAPGRLPRGATQEGAERPGRCAAPRSERGRVGNPARHHWGDRAMGLGRVCHCDDGAGSRPCAAHVLSTPDGQDLAISAGYEGNATLPLCFVTSHDRILVEAIGDSACLTNESVCHKERSIC